MEVGKRYTTQFSNYQYECISILPSGNAVISGGLSVEYVVSKDLFKAYKEVKEKKKVYVFLSRMKDSNWRPSSHILKENGIDNRNWHLERGREVSEIKEVEFDV